MISVWKGHGGTLLSTVYLWRRRETGIAWRRTDTAASRQPVNNLITLELPGTASQREDSLGSQFFSREDKATNLGCQIADPHTVVLLPWQQPVAAVVQLPAHWRVRVRHHLSVQLVHNCQSHLVIGKVDETIAGGLTGELVRHHLEAEGKVRQKQEEGVLKR